MSMELSIMVALWLEHKDLLSIDCEFKPKQGQHIYLLVRCFASLATHILCKRLKSIEDIVPLWLEHKTCNLKVFGLSLSKANKPQQDR